MLLEEKVLRKEQSTLEQKSGNFAQQSRYFALRADPTRLKILHLLRKHQELCVTDLASILGLTVSAVSHQLAMLERASEVRKTKQGKIACYSCCPDAPAQPTDL